MDTTPMDSSSPTATVMEGSATEEERLETTEERLETTEEPSST